MAGVGDRAEKFKMGQAAHVVEIERVCRIAGPSDISVRPMRGGLQVKIGIRLLHRGRQRAVGAGERKVKFGSAKLHVIAPLAFRIKIEWSGGQQLARRIRIREREDMLCRNQTLIRKGWIRSVEDLIASREIRGEPARKIRTDQRTRWPSLEQGAIADVLQRRVGAAECVVNLR